MARFAELFLADAAGDRHGGTGDHAAEVNHNPVAPFGILLVDDEPGVLSAVKRIFLEENYRIYTAADAESAVEILEQQEVQLVISDYRMPGRNGAELLKEIKQRWPETIRIMLTGQADVQSVMGAVNDGAVYKFITKPWNDEDLRLTVSLALQQFALLRENRKLRELSSKQQHQLKNYATMLGDNLKYLRNILVHAGLLTPEQFAEVAAERLPNEHQVEALVRQGLVKESQLIKVLQDVLQYDYIDLLELDVPREVLRLFPIEVCLKNLLVPIGLNGRELTLAMADPSDIGKCDDLARMSGLKILPVIARATELRELLQQLQGASEEETDFDLLDELDPIDEVDIVIENDEDDISVQELLNSSGVPPIIRIVNAIISEAIRYKASDIHIEPKAKATIIRFRIDGMLHDKIRIPSELHNATVSRIKIIAKLDISERRKPQDGRIAVKSGTRMVDLRVSTMPSINGEKVVMRILDKSASIKPLHELGLLPADLRQVNGIIRKPQGIIIATGPTGSGKTTLLYSILQTMLQRCKNFETIEDPVEYYLEDANQVFVKEKAGLSFASVLRATLRQDPDVILVGEVRDLETADVAFKAALTGHMVLTTLHTNNSIASITRLIDLGIKPYLISSALEGIVAQRLARTLCQHCRELGEPKAEELELLQLEPQEFADGVWQPRGCPRCNQTGYKGRTGIYEIFVMDDDYRHLISDGYRESKLLESARANGMKNLLEAGVEKVRLGETSLEELLRVIGPQIRQERTCEKCQHKIDARYIYCPFCGHVKQNICLECKLPMEAEWQLCPFCGTERGQNLSGEKERL